MTVDYVGVPFTQELAIILAGAVLLLWTAVMAVRMLESAEHRLRPIPLRILPRGVAPAPCVRLRPGIECSIARPSRAPPARSTHSARLRGLDEPN